MNNPESNQNFEQNRAELDPATDEMKEAIYYLVNEILGPKPFQPNYHQTERKEEYRNQHVSLYGHSLKVNIDQFKNHKDNIIARIGTVADVPRKRQEDERETKNTWYDIEKTPIDLQIRKATQYFKRTPPPWTQRITEKDFVDLEKDIEERIEASALEREIGLQFFSQKDAEDVIRLLQDARSEILKGGK